MDSTVFKKAMDEEFKGEGECIVAFLDILGFEEHVKRYVNPKYSQDKKILENIKFAMNESLEIVKQGKVNDLNLVKYKIFSDCTSLSIPVIPDLYGTNSEALVFCLLISLIVSYTINLIKRNIYLRGGISVGFHYEDDNMIFSDGLIKAHDLESKKAIYPRVILDKKLVQQFKRLWIDQKETILMFGTEKMVIIDKKGTVFINPFNILQSMDKWNLKDLKKSFNNEKDFEDYLLKNDNDFNMKILRNVETKIEEYKNDNHILNKYLWLKDLINWNINPESSNKFEYLLKSK